MIILGLNAYHGDSSACLVIDGKVINAIEEERIRRIKHWAGLPVESVKWCLKDGNLTLRDVDFIAVARDPSSHLYKKLLMGITKTSMQKFVKDRLSNVLKMQDIKVELAECFGEDQNKLKAKVMKVEHHKAHIASAFFVSPFSDAACVSIDGFGDFLSTLRAVGKENEIKIIDWVEYPHSLGVFYTAFTQYLGFPNYGDEYKVMGLSAYGRPKYLTEIRKIVKLKDNGLFELDTSFFNHAEKGVEMVWEGGSPKVGRLFSDKLVELLGPPREQDQKIANVHMDIASSLQAIYEEVFFHILGDIYSRTSFDNLALAGGCIQNSLANGKILKKTKFKDVYIPPATYDAGLAVGAAMYVWHAQSKCKRSFVMESPYLGPEFTNDEIKEYIKNYSCEFFSNEDILCEKVVELIANGNIIGWFQGRAEWGPRALGNRSILVDPRKKEMRDVLNQRVKKREWFRPFAPSVLEEEASKWFYIDLPSPFMEKVCLIKEDKRSIIPAVCHADNTGRVQTVSKKLNLRYYKLIKRFQSKTGVPILLNTSFNDNEPIVNTPSDAIQCFLATKMDVLVLNNYLILKNGK